MSRNQKNGVEEGVVTQPTQTTKLSWGRAHRYVHEIKRLRSKDLPSILAGDFEHAIPHGMGRSYGDTALSDGGAMLVTTGMDRIISVDWEKGVFRAEAGFTLDDLLKVVVPRGWFPAVTPGSKFVTLGGCIANDVHGKNHHNQGSFGTTVRAFGLRRSDNTKSITCTPKKNKLLFAATLGGLGLTGVIEWVEIQLKRIESAYLDVENIPYDDLDAFLKLSSESQDWDYSVAWIDCFAKGKSRGRGIFTRARFATEGALKPHGRPRMDMFFTSPSFLLNKFTIKSFNFLYRRRPGAKYVGKMHYGPFFYPLDGISRWNRLYGRKGFFQHQCLIPSSVAFEGISELLQTIERAGQGSFLAVLKQHGEEPSPGMISFCRSGLSLALDFGNKGPRTSALLQELDDIVIRLGGRLYPAKDGRMSPETFKVAFPKWKDVEIHRDPRLISAFWARILN